MVNFDKIIGESIAKVHNGFQAAVDSLEALVGKISEAIQKNTKRNFTLRLAILEEDRHGRIYRLYFDPNPDNSDIALVALDNFMIPSKGYPIQIGEFAKGASFSPFISIVDEAKLEEYFAKLLSNPDSSLIQAVGFGMRSKQE